MKSEIVCVLLVTFAVSVLCDPKGDFDQMVGQCKSEGKTNDADIQKFMETGQTAATDGVKCFIKCLMEKQGDLKNGVFNVDNVVSNLKQNPALKDRMGDIEKAIDQCKNEKGVNECDTAFQITMCLKKFKLNK